MEALLRDVYSAFGEASPDPAALSTLVGRSAAGGSGLTFLVAEGPDGEILGLLSVAACPTTRDAGEFVYLDDLHVREDARGRGIGTELLAAARRWATDRGASEIRLATDATNEALWRLYRGAGYERQSMSWMILPLGRDWSRRRR